MPGIVLKENIIEWKIFIQQPCDQVFNFINSNEGRSKFWAEKAVEKNGAIYFEFINGWHYTSKIINREAPNTLEIEYFNSQVTITLQQHKSGTEIHLRNQGVSDAHFNDVYAGWVSVLLALKAAVEFNIDIRNHDPSRCWDQRFVEN